MADDKQKMTVKIVYTISDDEFARMDPGIRQTVRTLLDGGFKVFRAGEGKDFKPQFDLWYGPYVTMTVDPSQLVVEADRLRDLIQNHGVHVWNQSGEQNQVEIHANYDPGDGTATLALIGFYDALLTAERSQENA